MNSRIPPASGAKFLALSFWRLVSGAMRRHLLAVFGFDFVWEFSANKLNLFVRSLPGYIFD